MSFRNTIQIAAGALLSLLVVAYAVRIAGHYHTDLPAGRIELGRTKITQLDESTVARLATLKHDVLVTYYVSSRAHMPSDMRRIERDVVDLLTAMRNASGGMLDYQVVDPETDQSVARHAAHQRVAPFRVRSIAHDSYSERTVWSSLHISYGPHEAAVINGVSQTHLPRLQAMIVGQLDQKDQPRRPVYGIAAPGGYERLADWLSLTGDVVRVALDGTREIPEAVDVLFWMDPLRADASAVRQMQQFLDSGRSIIVAGSRHAARQERRGPITLQATEYDPEFLLASFGLRPIDGLVLDEFSQDVPGDVAPVPARFFVRCIPPNQDFREMRDLPNGHLLFAVPTPLSLDHDHIAQRGYAATVLATTSDRTSIADMLYGEVNLASAAWHSGDPVPKLPLMVWLRPLEPWRGSLVVSASSTLLSDSAFEAEGFAHRRLVDVLTATLASDERLVIHRAGFEIAQPLPLMSGWGRMLWRSLCIGAFPVAIGLAAWRRHVFVIENDQTKRRSWRLREPAMIAVLLLLVNLAVSYTPSGRIDLTADRVNRLASATTALASQCTDDRPVSMTLMMSRPQNLPPEMRPMMRRLGSVIAEFERTGAELSIRWLHPEDLSSQRREALEVEGVRPVRVTTRDEDRRVVRSVYSTIKLEGNGRVEYLHFPNSASFEHLEFRLAFALWRLQTGRQPHIAFASDVPRLSAAEAYHDFQQRSLLAPTGTDVYSHARAALQQVDFRVSHLNPRSPHIPEDVDLIVWMQPRRNVLPMLDLVVNRLNEGVPVMIAAQQFNMQARQYRGGGFETVYWPQPQVVDLHLHYLPDIGVKLVHEVLFDQLHGQMPLQTQVNRDANDRDYESQASALPFLIRASAANFLEHTIMHNIGDQLLPFAAYWQLDHERLEELDIAATTLFTTSGRSWTYDWSGGWIPQDLLTGPSMTEDQQSQWRGRLPLAVLLEGVFPKPVAPLVSRRLDSAEPLAFSDDRGTASSLLLVGCSEMFKNDRLRSDDYRADHLLLNAAAHLALDDQLASIASHRRVTRGFDYIDVPSRLRWRAGVVGAGPVFMLLFAATWLAARSASGRRWHRR